MKLFYVGLLSLLNAAAAAPSDASKNEDYVIDFDLDAVKKENLQAVEGWLHAKGIDTKESEMESYAAYIVAELNKNIGTPYH